MDFQPLQLQPQVSAAPFTEIYPQRKYLGPRPTVLLILDGWGIGPNYPGNAITQANLPNMRRYQVAYPHTQLSASGQAVGLPHNEDGNTETGHLNIGAGSIIYQDLPRINMSIADGSFYNNSAFLRAIAHARSNQTRVHLLGLVGAGGVHSNIEHLYALLQLCRQQQFNNVYIHAITDGRDSPPTASPQYLQQIIDVCQRLGVGRISTVMGRFYAMDRDKRYDRVEKAYNCLVLGQGRQATDPISAVQDQHQAGVTDEFIEPCWIQAGNDRAVTIDDRDAVIFFNYRIDRPRQLTRAFVRADFEQAPAAEGFDPYLIKYQHSHLSSTQLNHTFTRQKILNQLYFVTMTQYEESLSVDVAFPPQNVKNPLCQVFAENGLRQLRMAETEKQKFVTYYLNGQREIIFPGETRIIIPSKGSKSYDQTPEMSAREITAHLLQQISADAADAIIVNFANADMVAHTGNLPAAITACEVIDECVGRIVTAVNNRNGVTMITADHGNAEEMINPQTGAVDTEHSIYPVPFIIIGNRFLNRPIMMPTGILADIAPTLLAVMGIAKPESMTGRCLLPNYSLI